MSELDKGGIAGHYIKHWTETPTEIISRIDHECRSIFKGPRESERGCITAQLFLLNFYSVSIYHFWTAAKWETLIYSLSAQRAEWTKRGGSGERRAD